MSKNFEFLMQQYDNAIMRQFTLVDVMDLNHPYSLVTVTSFYIIYRFNTQPLNQKKWRISESNR